MVCACVGRSNIAITPNTQADLQNVARLGRDVEMCSGKKKAARHRKVQSRQSESACIRHLHRTVPIPFSQNHPKIPRCVFLKGRQAGKKEEEEAREKSRTYSRLAKIGQLSADDVF